MRRRNLRKMTLAVLAAASIGSAVLAGEVTFTKPADPSKTETKDGIQMVRSFKITLAAIDGEFPDLSHAMEIADVIAISGMSPMHACDTASDCEREVARTCRAAGQTGRDTNTHVTMSWNSSVGVGTCSGSCAGGGTVDIACKSVDN